MVCGLNWVGDSLMAMPALQAWQAAHAGRELIAVVKPGLAALWRMHPAVREVIELRPGLRGAWEAARRVRATGARRAYVLPHSFRSALVPFLAGVPERVGLPGHGRDFLLTRVVPPPATPGREHQGYEYLALVAPDHGDRPLPPVALMIPAEAEAGAAGWMQPGTWVGLLPGAARGPAKRWPASHFEELGRRLIRNRGDVRIVLLGGPGEEELCREVTEGIGSPRVLNRAGQTGFAEWAAALKRCAVIVANDSGGMHLAAAVGTPVVALYGSTDPAKTGPLGRSRVLQRDGVRSRDVARASGESAGRLAAISPLEVEAAVEGFLAAAGGPAASTPVEW